MHIVEASLYVAQNLDVLDFGDECASLQRHIFRAARDEPKHLLHEEEVGEQYDVALDLEVYGCVVLVQCLLLFLLFSLALGPAPVLRLVKAVNFKELVFIVFARVLIFILI